MTSPLQITFTFFIKVQDVDPLTLYPIRYPEQMNLAAPVASINKPSLNCCEIRFAFLSNFITEESAQLQEIYKQTNKYDKHNLYTILILKCKFFIGELFFN